MAPFILILLVLQCSIALKPPDHPALHYQLHRRRSRFSHHKPANLTWLSEVLAQVEYKYSWTYRDTEKNRLIRRWDPATDEIQMLDRAGLDDVWYFELEVGQPSQSIEVDLDMLSPDFYSIMTTAAGGSKYDTFQSQTYVSSQRYVHPVCRLAKDTFGLGHTSSTLLDWPVCQASHSSRHTLRKSGTILGLAPHGPDRRSTLSRLDHPSFLHNLYDSDVIPRPVWSITLLDSTSGILTLGGTLAREMEEAKARTELELKYIDDGDGSERVAEELKSRLSLLGSTPDQQFKWSEVSGSTGWWTGLITGIWINGVKVIKNQPFLMDVNCPFILAPASAFDQFYHGISGARHVETPGGNFAVFPCLNPPRIAIELAGWQFPVMGQGTREDILHGPAGGRFSLGKLPDLDEAETTRNTSHVNSGFCVGAVVKTMMGEREEWKRSGMKGVWVLGEPFFRGIGMVFDEGGEARMGFRSY